MNSSQLLLEQPRADRAAPLACGNWPRSGAISSSLATLSHWNAKSSLSDLARGSASMRLTCAASTSGFAQSCFCGELQQLLVRQAAPQEEGQTRRQLQVAQRRAPRRVACRFGAIEEMRARQDRAERVAHAALEAVRLAVPARRTPSAGASPRRSPGAGRRAARGSRRSSRRTGRLVGRAARPAGR